VKTFAEILRCAQDFAWRLPTPPKRLNLGTAPDCQNSSKR
jgi:hypothetical protein